ncbi:hypothetical protein ODZ83_07560 [Acaricomes phytoseiuli]|uniref:hypothetical protein n=1 Tax=Acaricomes phytoseiuli TaxID=291968 RepID=UPI0003A74E33|nr:hypothetical protein [Acaricomes phytoseiuli]MCW1250038.1 hypothetical protein [Acaricomes phytoseiuli]
MSASIKGIPGWMWLSAEPVVHSGLRASAAGRSVHVPTLRYRIFLLLNRLLPERLSFLAGRRGR